VKKDDVFLQSSIPASGFEFNDDVAAVFDDMLERSIPFYSEQQNIIRNLVKRMWIPETTVYDLGCSTGSTIIGLGKELPDSAQIVGYDNSQAMLDRARRNVEESGLTPRICVGYADLNASPCDWPLANAGAVTMCWTLQFVRPLRRDNVIRWIYENLRDDGVLIVTEKILSNNGDMNRFFIDIYYEFKRRNGYSETEILRKREALENVLIPYRIEENLDLFRRNGFERVETFFQWFNFAGFLCIKKPFPPVRPGSKP